MHNGAELAYVRSLAEEWDTLEPLQDVDLNRAADLMQKYPAIGFVDATVVAVAERLRAETIATTDRRDFSWSGRRTSIDSGSRRSASRFDPNDGLRSQARRASRNALTACVVVGRSRNEQSRLTSRSGNVRLRCVGSYWPWLST